MKYAVLAITVVAAVANWWSRWRDDARTERWAKPLATVGVIGIAVASGAPTEQVVVATVALVLCLAGDVFLMPMIDRFVFGLASFLLGHLVFVVLFAQYGLDHPWLGAVAMGLTVVLVATGARRIVHGAATYDATLKVPVTAYLFVISAMAVVGFTTGRPWVIAGVTLFVVSDTVLGWRQFVNGARWMPVTIMVTYHGAIASLALSLW